MWDIKNINELDSLDFNLYNQDSKFTVRKSNDNSLFMVSGEICNQYTKEQIEAILLTENWCEKKPIINEINVDYVNNTCTSTLSDLTVVDLGLWDDIIELRTIFEDIYTNPINTIKATFTSGSILIFNNDLTVNCSTIATDNPGLFQELSRLFQNIKMSIMFKIN